LAIPILPEWRCAGMTMLRPTLGERHSRPVDQRLTAEIEAFADAGDPIYARFCAGGICRRADHPQRGEQKQTIERCRRGARFRAAAPAGEMQATRSSSRDGALQDRVGHRTADLAALKHWSTISILANNRSHSSGSAPEEIMEISILHPRAASSASGCRRVYCESCASVSNSSGDAARLCTSPFGRAECCRSHDGPHSLGIGSALRATMRIELDRARSRPMETLPIALYGGSIRRSAWTHIASMPTVPHRERFCFLLRRSSRSWSRLLAKLTAYMAASRTRGCDRDRRP